MNVGGAAEHVAAFLDVDPGRYPVTTVGIAHVNEAMLALYREYDLPQNISASNVGFTHTAAQEATSDWIRYPGSIHVDTIFSDTEFRLDAILEGWASPFKSENRLCASTFEEMMDEYGDEEGSAPEKYAVFADRLFIRPYPALGDIFRMRFTWAGFPVELTSDAEPRILRKCSWGVVYRACEVASGWTLEDQRIPLFTQARDAHMEAAGLTASLTGDSQGDKLEMQEP